MTLTCNLPTLNKELIIIIIGGNPRITANTAGGGGNRFRG